MEPWELTYLNEVMYDRLHDLTREYGSKGRNIKARKMSSTDMKKAMAIEKGIKILNEFGTIDVNKEDLTEWERQKYDGTIKHFKSK